MPVECQHPGGAYETFLGHEDPRLPGHLAVGFRHTGGCLLISAQDHANPVLVVVQPVYYRTDRASWMGETYSIPHSSKVWTIRWTAVAISPSKSSIGLRTGLTCGDGRKSILRTPAGQMNPPRWPCLVILHRGMHPSGSGSGRRPQTNTSGWATGSKHSRSRNEWAVYNSPESMYGSQECPGYRGGRACL